MFVRNDNQKSLISNGRERRFAYWKREYPRRGKEINDRTEICFSYTYGLTSWTNYTIKICLLSLAVIFRPWFWNTKFCIWNIHIFNFEVGCVHDKIILNNSSYIARSCGGCEQLSSCTALGDCVCMCSVVLFTIRFRPKYFGDSKLYQKVNIFEKKNTLHFRMTTFLTEFWFQVRSGIRSHDPIGFRVRSGSKLETILDRDQCTNRDQNRKLEFSQKNEETGMIKYVRKRKYYILPLS